jgi:hypothetical protein
MDKQPTAIKIRVSIQVYEQKRQQYIPRRNLIFHVDPQAGAPGSIAATAEALTEVVKSAMATWSEI